MFGRLDSSSWAEPLSRIKRLNGFSEVLRSFEGFLISAEKSSVYFSEVYNPTPINPPHAGGGGGKLLRSRTRTSQKWLKTSQNF
jgi:hypothetical protein